MKIEAVVMIILFLAVGYLYFENIQLTNQLLEMDKKATLQISSLSSSVDSFKETTTNSINMHAQNILDTSSRLAALNETLRSTIGRMSNVESEISSAEQKINDINRALNNTKQEYLGIKSQIQLSQDSLQSRLSWLKINAYLPQSISGYYGRASNVCKNAQGLNMACVPFYTEQDLNFVYRSDSSDELYSIENMVERKGGDCEDFSLFIKAFINSFKNSTSAVLYGWEDGAGNFTILDVSDGTWTYRNAQKREFGNSEYFYPYAICFTTIPLVEGHCVVALSTEQVNATTLDLLNGSIVFEPQNGKYLGKIGTNYIVCSDGDKKCDQRVSHIHIIIGNEDLFNFFDGNWNSFSLFSSELSGMEAIANQRIDSLTAALSVD